VTDSRSGANITGKVLAQIIIDLDPAKLGVFPTALLHRLLRANDQLIHDFKKKYFNTALTAFHDSQRQYEQTVSEALGLDSSTSATVADWTNLMKRSFSAPLAESSSSSSGDDRAKSEMEDLRRQVKDLERRLGEPRKEKYR
jgi:polyhydroxyalkanoate synthesis regulator protein